MKGNLAVVQEQADTRQDENVVQLLRTAVEAEQAVLGALLSAADGMARVMSILQPEHFYRGAHRKIYEVMLDLQEAGQEIDLVSVTLGLTIHNALEQVGGKRYLADLFESIATTSSLEYSAHAVRSSWARRQTIKFAQQMKDAAWSATDMQEMLDGQLSRMAEFTSTALAKQKDDMPAYLREWYDFTELRYEHRGELVGLSSGFPAIDRFTNGFQAGDFIVIFARPSIGKSAALLNMFWRESVRGPNQKRLAFFSAEMAIKKVLDRLMSMHTGIRLEQFQRGFLDHADFGTINKAMSTVMDSGLMLIDADGATVAQIEAQTRGLIAAGVKLDAIGIDYLQLMKSAKERESRQIEVGEIAKDCKSMAKRLKLPVITLALAGRGCEGRRDKRPELQDLRESGDIEAAADMAIALYRDQFYNPETPRKDCMEWIFRKNRDGETGTAYLAFSGATQTLFDWDPDVPVPDCTPPEEDKPRYSRRKKNDGGTYAPKEE